MIESKFTFKAYLFGAIVIIIPAIHSTFFFIGAAGDNPLDWMFFMLPVFLILIFFLGTFRTQMIKVKIDSRELTVKNYFGFGPEKKYRFKDLQGFHTSTLTAKNTTYDALYIMKDGKKVAKISSQFISNYEAVHNFVSNNLSDLGYIETNLITELKDTLNFKRP